MSRVDPHSYFDDAQPRSISSRLRLRADFERKVLRGEATLLFADAAKGPLDLDTKGLTIESAVADGRSPVPFQLGPEESVLGRRLRLELPANTMSVTLTYETSPAAVGLQWLSPEQTDGYFIRRLATDHGIPLITNVQLAKRLVEAMIMAEGS